MNNIKEKYPKFMTVDDALELKRNDIFELQKKFQNTRRVELLMQMGYAQNFVSAKEDGNGVELYDDDGNVHYDFIGNVGCMNVGNANPFVWEQIEKAKDVPALHAMGLRSMSAALANNLAMLSPGNLSKVWTGASGSEANEGAIKLCKMTFKGARHKFVALKSAFHGKTAGAIALTGKDKWRLYQEPVMPDVKHVTKENIAELEDALHFSDVAGFIVEPIQGEGGIHPLSVEYLKAARELCTKYGTLMICDEIQCGLGRAGTLWAFEHAGIVPDVVTFAKSMSGGYIPIGGYITTEEVWNNAYGEDLTCFHHTNTYANNTLGCAAGIAALQFILENDLMSAAAKKGEYILEKLKENALKYPEIVKEVRGKGLMIGVEFHENMGEAFAMAVNATMMHKYRVQSSFSANNPVVIRILPPLTVTEEQIEIYINAYDKAVQEVAEQFAQAAAPNA